IGKITKLAQGAMDLHSARSQVDFKALAALVGVRQVADANTALEAFEMGGAALAQAVAEAALAQVNARFGGAGIGFDIVVIDRAGAVIAKAAP
ncbi:MAG: cobalt-precorrin-5B (C(1))-methyltransferase, partial [Paracoccaceae bacterium]|nr:cobalt-precorrin-5B (C(1))-methyltransferase [Paracoccaceae bacterium]